MPVECLVGGDTDATLQPDNGGHGGDASDEGRECWVGGETDATSQPRNQTMVVMVEMQATSDEARRRP
uniref:Uncharacterized protein n=1 Tax=Fagus sylvatica TaxID=28930 RepID=A0A2N9EEX7_FAGSY